MKAALLIALLGFSASLTAEEAPPSGQGKEFPKDKNELISFLENPSVPDSERDSLLSTFRGKGSEKPVGEILCELIRRMRAEERILKNAALVLANEGHALECLEICRDIVKAEDSQNHCSLLRLAKAFSIGMGLPVKEYEEARFSFVLDYVSALEKAKEPSLVLTNTDPYAIINASGYAPVRLKDILIRCLKMHHSKTAVELLYLLSSSDAAAFVTEKDIPVLIEQTFPGKGNNRAAPFASTLLRLITHARGNGMDSPEPDWQKWWGKSKDSFRIFDNAMASLDDKKISEFEFRLSAKQLVVSQLEKEKVSKKFESISNDRDCQDGVRNLAQHFISASAEYQEPTEENVRKKLAEYREKAKKQDAFGKGP